jgi:hypothetical protein
MLNAEIEFKDNTDFIEMWWESDSAPFEDKLMGCLRKGEDGHYRFHPARKVILTCKHLRVLAQKCSDLNCNEI